MKPKELIPIIESLTGLKYNYCQETFKGGSVLEPTCRYAENVYIVDYKRFYANIILMNNLFGGRLNSFIEELLKRDDKDAKLMLATLYGQMKHFDFKETQRVTEIGRHYIKFTIELLKINFKVISSDTDSVTIVCNNPRELLFEIDKISNIINSTSKNPQKTFKLGIENYFKYIYFFPSDKGFKKKQYLGVKDDNQIILKSRALNYDEEISWSFIVSKLRQGKYQVNIDEFINFAMKIKTENDIFINLDNITILELVKPTVKL